MTQILYFLLLSNRRQQVAWTYYQFTIQVGMTTLELQKCATCSLRSALLVLWMQTKSGCHQCWVSPDWLSVRCCRSRPQSKRILTDLPSSPSSSLCRSYFLNLGSWGTWCCSWGQLRNRSPRSSGCNKNETQFSLHCAQSLSHFKNDPIYLLKIYTIIIKKVEY